MLFYVNVQISDSVKHVCSYNNTRTSLKRKCDLFLSVIYAYHFIPKITS